MHLIGSVGFGQHGDGARARMCSALRFRCRNALHAMATRLKPQLAVDAVALNAKHNFLVATKITRRLRHDFGAPTPPLAIPQVHPRQIGGEQCRLVTPGAGANLDERIACVIRIVRQQCELQFAMQTLDVRARLADFILGQFSHVGIGQQGSGGHQVLLTRLEARVQLGQRRRFGMLFAQRTIARHVGAHRRVGERRFKLAQAQREAFELLTKRVFHALSGVTTSRAQAQPSASAGCVGGGFR